jgi:hypothetical protein
MYSDDTLAVDCLNLAMDQLERVAERIVINTEGVDDETVKSWSERILRLSREIASVKAASIGTTSILNSLSANMTTFSHPDSTTSTFRESLKRRIHEENSGFDANLDLDVQRIDSILNKQDTTLPINDFEFVKTEFGLSNTICPFTRLTYVHPMKRYYFAMFMDIT